MVSQMFLNIDIAVNKNVLSTSLTVYSIQKQLTPIKLLLLKFYKNFWSQNIYKLIGLDIQTVELLNTAIQMWPLLHFWSTGWNKKLLNVTNV